MCGACPGGAGISRLSAYAGLTGIRSGTAALLQQIAGRRLGIQAFGDQWVLRTRTGSQRVVPGLEEAAAAVAAGPVDWEEVARLTGQPITGRAPGLMCPALDVLDGIAAAPLRQPMSGGKPDGDPGGNPDEDAGQDGGQDAGQDPGQECRPELTAGEFTAALLVRAANAQH